MSATLAKSSYSESASSMQMGLALSWWGRWDLNPGSPTPQAGILNQSSTLQPSIAPKLPQTEPSDVAIRRPQELTKYKEQINKTIAKAIIEGKAYFFEHLAVLTFEAFDSNTVRLVNSNIVSIVTEGMEHARFAKEYIKTANGKIHKS